jgi:hypothetical protein
VPFRVTISRTLSFRTTSSVKGVFNEYVAIFFTSRKSAEDSSG